MIGLFGMAFTASFFDSLNPSAIAQLMLLLTLVKKKRHIWAFISGMSLANIVLGLGIYYGIIAQLTNLFRMISMEYPMYTFTAEIALGAILAVLGVILVFRTRKKLMTQQETESGKSPASISPVALFIMGAVFCGIELTSAMPYFGFLTFLTGHHLAFYWVIIFISFYTFIYASPLILIYFGYNRIQGTRMIQKVEMVLSKVSAYIVPVAIGLVGSYMVYHGSGSLL